MLSVGRPRQAGPDVGYQLYGSAKVAGQDQRIRAALFDLLDSVKVLTDRPEVGEVQLCLVVWPVRVQDLIPARCGAILGAFENIGVIGVTVKQ